LLFRAKAAERPVQTSQQSSVFFFFGSFGKNGNFFRDKRISFAVHQSAKRDETSDVRKFLFAGFCGNYVLKVN
jgi:hypothetical protein